ncbi:MAG: YaeQ family protein [Bdellovibrio sp.]|nr:YaeQ family protein [Bdellovibrio sp.]
MALAAKLFRFKIELSDLEKSSYRSLDFRVAQHPSETLAYLLTRVFAYALSYEDGIEFPPGGLSDPDSPAVRVVSRTGDVLVAIEVGNPSARKIHKVSKASKKLKIYTYKDPQVLLNEMATEQIHRRNEIEIYSIPISFLDRLAEKVKKENRWTLIYMDGSIMVNGEDLTEGCEIKRY